MKRKKEPILPLATLDFKMPRKRWGTIGWFKGSIVQRIVRKIPEKWQHIYHDCGENILAEVLYLQTDKGSLKITSCNYCSLLHIKKDGILLFEDLDFQVEKKHE